MQFKDVLTSVFEDSTDMVAVLDTSYCYKYFNTKYSDFCQANFFQSPVCDQKHLQQLHEILEPTLKTLQETKAKISRQISIKELDYEVSAFTISDTQDKTGLVYIIRFSHNQVNVDKFLLSLVHDLKNPVSAIIGLAQILEHQNSMSKQTAESARIIGRSAKRLVSIIDDVMLINKYTYHVQAIEYEDVDIQKLVEEIVEMDTQNIHQKNLKVTLNIKPPIIKTSKTHISHILINLINNAVKYSNNNGNISITLELNNNHYTLIVADTGIGISNKNISELFQPFTRFANNVTGTGLGLYLTKMLVEQLSGHISVSSALDVGTVFTCYLPQK
jgi:signal transduction histidine kinase